ncbi:MAG: OmpA family protein [Deltaproteobacteria bacterium]|nr:OmpA family protein [Deltaproteobacteria bacterium]
MKRVLFVVLCTLVAAAGCNKNQPQVVTADDAITVDPNDGKDKGDGNVETKPQVKAAEGEMKELLLVLQRVHFPMDTSTLTEPARLALMEASEKLKAMPEISLAVEGHTDARGTNEYNMSLAERRAQTVVKYLSSLGVEKERLDIAAYGEEKLLASGGGEVVNAQNRRVDFRLKQGNIEFVLQEGPLVDDHGKVIADAPPAPSDENAIEEIAPQTAGAAAEAASQE